MHQDDRGQRVAFGGSECAKQQAVDHQQIGVWPDTTFTPTSHSGATSANVLEVKNGKHLKGGELRYLQPGTVLAEPACVYAEALVPSSGSLVAITAPIWIT